MADSYHQLIDRLDAAAIQDEAGRLWLTRGQVMGFIDLWLREREQEQRALTAPVIIDQVERLLNAPNLVSSRRQSGLYPQARRACAIALSELLGLSTTQIAEAMGYRSHSSVHQLMRDGRRDPAVAEALKTLMQRFGYLEPDREPARDAEPARYASPGP